MHAQVVQHHDLARPQRRRQHLGHELVKDRSVHRAFKLQTRPPSVRSEGGEQGDGLPPALGHATYHALAAWSTTPARRQGGRRVRLIEKDQLTMIEGREFLTPDGPRGSILFAGNQRLFSA